MISIADLWDWLWGAVRRCFGWRAEAAWARVGWEMAVEV